MFRSRVVKYFLLYQILICSSVLIGYTIMTFVVNNPKLSALFIYLLVYGLLSMPVLSGFIFKLAFNLSVNCLVRLGAYKTVMGILVAAIIQISEYSIGRLVVNTIMWFFMTNLLLGFYLFFTFMFGAVIAFAFESIASKLKAYFKNIRG